MVMSLGLSACSEVSFFDVGHVENPAPTNAKEGYEAINGQSNGVMYLPLGSDVLMPSTINNGKLPEDIVGPFELRSENLGGALQLILADHNISIAFETKQGLSRKVTVANLKGPLDQVVNRVCSLADLYCSFESGGLVVKDTETFTVTLPFMTTAEGRSQFMRDVIRGLSAVLGEGHVSPVIDSTTRSIIYSATRRTSQLAEDYFQRLRARTAMIVFEAYIWEVSLDKGNFAGINWSQLQGFEKLSKGADFNGTTVADFNKPVSLSLQNIQSVEDYPFSLVGFLSQFGEVKTISQPQISILSGASAELRVIGTTSYVSQVSSTLDDLNMATSVSTDSVDSGVALNIGSSWDGATVYARVNVNLTSVDKINDFAFNTDGDGGQTIVQLPQTTKRELTTQIRVRPGDPVLIRGLVREVDNHEVVVMLRPRVIVYTAADDNRSTKGKDCDSTMPYGQRSVKMNCITPAVPVEPVELVPVSEKSIAKQLPAPSVSIDSMMSTPAIEMMENGFSLESFIATPVLEVVQINKRPRKGGRYISGFISRHVDVSHTQDLQRQMVLANPAIIGVSQEKLSLYERYGAKDISQ